MGIGLTDNQRLAIESIDKSMLVVAGAGSGKTLVLVRRFVEILQKQPELSVHNLLAVTYTHKAAKEMRTRIKARLKELYEQAKNEELQLASESGQSDNIVERSKCAGEAYASGALRDTRVEPNVMKARQRLNMNRWHQCLADMDSAYIDTIHSLCQSILRSFTIEIGLDPQIELLDKIEKAQIMQESMLETFRQFLAADNADKSIFDHFSIETLEEFLKVSLNNHLRFNQIATSLENLNTAELSEEIEKLLTRTQKQLLADLVIDEDWSRSGHYIKSGSFAEAGNKLEEVRRQAAEYFESIQKLAESLRQEQRVASNALGSDKYKPKQNQGQDANYDPLPQQEQIKEAWKILLDVIDIGAVRVGGNTDAAKEMRASIKTLIEKCKDYSQSKKKGYGLPLSFAASIGQNGDNEQYWQLWRALLVLAKQAQNNYAVKKLEIGKLDFDDLIAKTKSLLQAPNSAVKEYYNNTLAHILVDEFQDTNPVQAEIITLLAGAKTKLFLIGDDKQSIYKFQGADVSTFNAWQRKGIHSLVFEHSFRSQVSIVNFVNSIFSNLLPAQKAHVDYRATFSALIAQRDTDEPSHYAHIPQVEVIQLPEAAEDSDSDAAEITVEAGSQLVSNDRIKTDNNRMSAEGIRSNGENKRLAIGGDEGTGVDNRIASYKIESKADDNSLSADEIEGKAVVNWILDKVKNKTKITGKDGKSREINFGDFAVLAERNNDLQIFESCLSELNIPYVTSGGRTFLERQEIYDLENMLLFLSNPSNSHALLAVLRSPMFSVTDDIIHNLASTNAISLWQAMQDYVAKQSVTSALSITSPASARSATSVNSAREEMGYQPIGEAVIVLKRLLADMPVLSLSELVYRIIRDTNYDLVALSLPDGKQRYKNIWKFYILAKDEYSAAEFADRLALSRQLSVEQTNATIDNSQSVKLMTIHKAKGLEFPAVALPFLTNAVHNKKAKLLFHDQYGIVLNTARTEQERDEGVPLPYQLGKTLDDDMDIAEKMRLLYVATTRARDHLALFIGAKVNGDKSAAGWLQPILTKLEAGSFNMLAPQLDDLLVGAAERAGGAKRAKNETYCNEQLNLDIRGLSLEENEEDAIRLAAEAVVDFTKETAAEATEISASSIDKIEQLLEPMAINTGTQDLPLPAVSLFHRITPAANYRQPSPILVGKFFHRIMEYLPQDKTELEENELLALLEQFAEETVHTTIKRALIEEGKQLLAVYAKSELQPLFAGAKTICHEWSYYMNTQSDQLLLNRPDLLLESAADQWYLIDYKTDRFSTNGIEQQVLRHRAQLERYGKDFNQLTKIEAKLAIYFAQSGALHEI